MPKRKRYPIPVLSSDPAEKHEHSTPTRRSVQVLDKAGHSRKEIEAITHVTRLTQTKILQSGSYHRPGRERDGRPCKLEQEAVEKMIKSLHGRYKNRTRSWDQMAENFIKDECINEFGHPKLTISGRTVKRYLNEAGFYKCRTYQKAWITED